MLNINGHTFNRSNSAIFISYSFLYGGCGWGESTLKGKNLLFFEEKDRRITCDFTVFSSVFCHTGYEKVINERLCAVKLFTVGKISAFSRSLTRDD